MARALRLRAPSFRIAVSAAVLAAIWFEMLTLGTGALDEIVLRALYAGYDPLLAGVARGFTLFGEWWLVIAVSLVVSIWLLFARNWRWAVAVLAVTLVGRALVSAQKYGIERLRPDDQAHLVPVSTPSFPSGHAAGSMIVYLTLALLLTAGTRWKWPAVIAAITLSAFVGLSRVMLGVHWPTDVVGGWAFGLLWVLIALPLAERLLE
jgi:undecaprenyl-diphosphatase